MIVIIFAIYIRTGWTIYQNRKQLYTVDISNRYSIYDRPTSASRTVEITVTSEGVDLPAVGSPGQGHRRESASYAVFISSGLEPLKEDLVIPFSTKIATKPTEMAPATQPNHAAPRPRPVHTLKKSYSDHHNATAAYTKTAMLFFAVLLITWIPSSANRVFTLVHPSATNVALEYMSACVLPLQGFWNAIIYVFTSWCAFKSYFGDFKIGSRTKAAKPTTHQRPPTTATSNVESASHLQSQDSTDALV